MGNLFATPVPETEEFKTEFLRVQAAVAALPAEPDSQGDVESCQLRLQFVQLKIACAQARASRQGSLIAGRAA
jgi:hypothetical protein